MPTSRRQKDEMDLEIHAEAPVKLLEQRQKDAGPCPRQAVDEEAHHAPLQLGHSRKKLDGSLHDAPLHASSPSLAVFRSSPFAPARPVPPASLLGTTSAFACPYTRRKLEDPPCDVPLHDRSPYGG